MTIGGSIALIVIGAILRFAISWSPSSHVNVPLIGVILMIGGAVGLIISVSFLAARRRRTVAPPPADVYEERRYTQSPGRYTDPPV
jgi:hypothetical protein